MKTQKKANNWGGKRVGAGKKPLYEEPTVNITFRVPSSHRFIVKEMIREYLNKLKVKHNHKNHESEYGC